jgi:hypothetical protein
MWHFSFKKGKKQKAKSKRQNGRSKGETGKRANGQKENKRLRTPDSELF